MAFASLFSIFSSFVIGKRLIDGGDLQTLVKLIGGAPASGITAHAGGGQAAAFQLTQFMNEVAVVATAADSVVLPAGIPGMRCSVINDAAANSLQVFGVASNPNNAGAGDTIAPNTSNVQNATAVGVAQAAQKSALYECFAPGKWKQFLSA